MDSRSTRSVATPSRTWLVTTTFSAGAASIRSAASRPTPSLRCSALSSASSRSSGPTASASAANGSPPPSRTPSASATVAGSAAASATLASSTQQTPCRWARRRASSKCCTSRLLPMPPAPVTLTRAWPSTSAPSVARSLGATQQCRKGTRQARLQGVGRRHRHGRGVDRLAFDARREAVAAAGHGADQIATEHLAQGVHLHRDVALLDHEARPDTIEQLVLADQLAGPLGQDHQQVEGPCAERRRPAIDQQPSLDALQLEAAEAQRVVGG